METKILMNNTAKKQLKLIRIYMCACHYILNKLKLDAITGLICKVAKENKQ